MDCCGHAHGAGAPTPRSGERVSRRSRRCLPARPGRPVRPRRRETAETASAALAVLRRSISVDVHSHGGRTGITSKAPPSDDLANAMRAGALAVACLADVPDLPILGRSDGALAMVRMPAAGELYRYHLDRLAWMDELVAEHGVRRALCAADLDAAHKAGEPAIVADVEGLDFLDGKLERLEEAHQRGIRHVQLVHYTPNDIGDFQTGAVTHQGLTEFGAEAIRACHRLGLVCDVAHATEDDGDAGGQDRDKTAAAVAHGAHGIAGDGADAARGPPDHADHARAIAETGGSVGIWHFFPSLDTYVEGIKEMADIVGVDHVSIGTDQFDSRGVVEDYTRWVHLVAAMLRGGFTERKPGKSPAAITCASFARRSADGFNARDRSRRQVAVAVTSIRAGRNGCGAVPRRPGRAPCRDCIRGSPRSRRASASPGLPASPS